MTAPMEPRTRLILTTFAVTLAVGVGSGWAIGRKTIARPAPLPEPARPTPTAPVAPQKPPLPPETVQLLTDLGSADTATWREAIVRLAFTRPFPESELGLLSRSRLQPRVLEVLDAALGQCLPLDDVKNDALRELLAPTLAAARARLKDDLLVRSGDFDTQRPAPETGVAIAVALQALRSSDEQQVVRGLRAIERAKPACAKERVRALLGNGAMVADVDRATARVSEVADEALRALPAGTTPLAGLEAVLRDTPVFETVREVVPEAVRAESVDAWFELARPVWRAFWALADGGTPSEEAWRVRTHELLGFRETRRLHPRGRSLLHVIGRPSVACQVSTRELVEAFAKLPFDYEGDAPRDEVRLVCVSLGGAPVLDRWFTFEPGDELTIEVL
ncbi:MAG: hypothetical protein SFW67_35945 [Myxococcaceae bacterium]|nr:hypothetical protein [Myxococcaceae bacterium]